jgi:hypothetical protein
MKNQRMNMIQNVPWASAFDKQKKTVIPRILQKKLSSIRVPLVGLPVECFMNY